MKQNLKYLLLASCFLLSCINAEAIDFITQKGQPETATVSWTPVSNVKSYEATVQGNGVNTKVDDHLIRQYHDYIRVDVPGLKSGDYTITIKALDASGTTIDEGTTATLSVVPQNREGFAFFNDVVPGGYNSDGTPKQDAIIIYVSKNSVNTVTSVVKDKKGKATSYTGLANILVARSKGYDKTPLIIRVIGTINATDFEGLKDGNYINFQGGNNTDRLFENVTIEGVGSDATLKGYGICLKRTRGIEIRNLGIMLFGDDAVSLDTDNSNIWIHNNDFYYGSPGHDSDQKKGDGTIDTKYRSTKITISYNHFFDSGKVMGCGGATGEDASLLMTFHHNWFDHTDSRCPRLHYTTAHIYNNYYDGVATYGIGNTTESNAFVEQNVFRNVNRPMMISGQGTDKYDSTTGTYSLKGTFSGQDGGMTKAYDNLFLENTPKLVYQTENPTQFDAYLVTTRSEQLPDTVKSVTGGWAYSNFDTSDSMYVSVPTPVDQVVDNVKAYSGRLDGGDLAWQFDNSVDDKNHDVNTSLKQAITGYESSLVGIQAEDGITTGIYNPTVNFIDDTQEYNLSGQRISSSYHGIVVKKGKKYLRK